MRSSAVRDPMPCCSAAAECGPVSRMELHADWVRFRSVQNVGMPPGAMIDGGPHSDNKYDVIHPSVMIIEDVLRPDGCPDAVKRDYLVTAVDNFIKNESSMNADNVYTFYMDLYRVTDEDGAPLLDMIDIMRMYELKVSGFSERQRDHYVHSVNVFLLGLDIYVSNSRVRSAFSKAYGKGSFRSEEDLFLFMWGHASLFHDIGYPIEILHNLAKSFVCKLSNLGDEQHSTRIMMGVDPVDDIIGLDPAGPFEDVFQLLVKGTGSIGRDRHQEVEQVIRGYPGYMLDNRFIDHGFFSSLMVAKCYDMIAGSNSEMMRIYSENIPSVCAAILMHNLYQKSLIRENGFGPMTIDEEPLTFLLILCDELQEWNRKSYGFGTGNSIYPKSSEITVGDDWFRVNYCFDDGVVTQESSKEKESIISRYLDVKGVFPEGLRITSSRDNKADDLLSGIEADPGEDVPRLLNEQILEIAKAIHEHYNGCRRAENPSDELEYPSWDSLTQDLKYSNMDQALDIPRKLRSIGCHIEAGEGGLTHFNEDELLKMAIMEHERWMNEKISNGWVLGKEKNVECRISPYLVPWEELEQDIKERDVEAVEGIIDILNGIGLRVVRDEGAAFE